MSSPATLPRIPILWALIPFVLGIILNNFVQWPHLAILVAATALVAYVLLARLSRTPGSRYRFAPYYAIPISLLFISLGFADAWLCTPNSLSLATVNGKYAVAKIDEVRFYDFSMSLKSDISGFYDSTKHFSATPKTKAIITTKGCNYALRAGDMIVFKANLAPIANNGNPDEVDYAGILLRQGFRYTQHIDHNSVFVCGHDSGILSALRNARTLAQRRILSTNLHETTKSILIATLLGNSDFVDQQMRQDFANAGIAHLLALSGLHIGILTFLLWWLLFPLDYCSLKKLRLVITMLCLLLYTAFTGFSPSVMRAAVMFGFVLLALLSGRPGNAFSSLAFAAMAILVLSPMSLYSAGFQLSFITVLSLLLFSQIQTTHLRHKAINHAVSLLLTSVVAMLSTLALTAFYFHTISIMGALTNMLVLPIFPAFLFVGVLFLLFSLAGVQMHFVTSAMDLLGKYITSVADIVNGMPFSHIDGIYICKASVLLYFLALGCTFLWTYNKKSKLLLCALTCIAAMAAVDCTAKAMMPSKGIVIFNDFSSTPVLCFNQGQAVVWVPDNADFDLDAFKHRHIGFLAHYGIVSIMPASSGSNFGISINENSAVLFGKRFFFAENGHWKRESATKLSTDYLIVGKSFHGKIQDLFSHVQSGNLVLSGAIYTDTKEKLIGECRRARHRYWSLADSGAIVITHGI